MIDHCEHIDWIDGAKGIAILSVILLHSLPCLHEIGAPFHIGQAVPLFIFITAFLTSFRYTSFVNYYSLSRIGKMLKRVFVPFLIVLILQILFCQLGGNWWSWKSIIKQGGIGPGSYYVWLYLQIWFMLPFILELVKRVPVWLSLSLMLVVSIFAEYLFVLMPHFEHIECLYRLLPIRYLMVVYLGCLWPKLSENYKKWFYVLAFFSAVLLFIDTYFTDLQSIAITPPLLARMSLVYLFLCVSICSFIVKDSISSRIASVRKK